MIYWCQEGGGAELQDGGRWPLGRWGGGRQKSSWRVLSLDARFHYLYISLPFLKYSLLFPFLCLFLPLICLSLSLSPFFLIQLHGINSISIYTIHMYIIYVHIHIQRTCVISFSILFSNLYYNFFKCVRFNLNYFFLSCKNDTIKNSRFWRIQTRC